MQNFRLSIVMSLSLVILVGISTPRGNAFAVTNITSNIAANTTWTTASSTYIIQNNISINSGVTLTINPGVVVKFKATTTVLTVNGTLKAEGTATSSIYFTSYKDDAVGGNSDGVSVNPVQGNWGYITTGSNATTTFTYVTVRYGGGSNYYMLRNGGGKLDIQNSTIASSTRYGISHSSGNTIIATSTFNGSGYYGIYSYPSSGTISITGSNFYNNATAAGYFGFGSGLTTSNSGNTATGTGKRGFIITDTINTNTTWLADTMPYIIAPNGFSINYGYTLTVNPGAVVKFENNSSYMSVGGTLNATGNSVQPIYFTSIKDDVLNDTDASATTTPSAGDWQHITTSSGGTITLKYATVCYGGADASSYANIWNNGGTINISTSTISNASSYGIYHGGGTTNTTQSSLFNNGSQAIHNSTYSTTTATNNYWGNLSGPYNAKYNPSGTGNGVSDYVSFNPWLGQTHYASTTSNSVDSGKRMDWTYDPGSTQQYSTEVSNGISAWNALGGVDIEPDDLFHILDLTLYETDDVDLPVGAYYEQYDKIEYNKHFMSGYPSSLNQFIVTHELGHALGLLHSYIGNIMNFSATTQTTLGTQDISDNSYCWISDNCTPKHF